MLYLPIMSGLRCGAPLSAQAHSLLFNPWFTNMKLTASANSWEVWGYTGNPCKETFRGKTLLSVWFLIFLFQKNGMLRTNTQCTKQKFKEISEKQMLTFWTQYTGSRQSWETKTWAASLSKWLHFEKTSIYNWQKKYS